jgi:integrase
MLRQLKALAERAGLPGKFELHKFRKTYATLQHKQSVDARTIQKRLGHSSLETTLQYLEGEESRERAEPGASQRHIRAVRLKKKKGAFSVPFILSRRVWFNLVLLRRVLYDQI